MDKLLIILDSDVTYAIRFMEYMKNMDEPEFEVSVFSKKDSLLDYIKVQKVDVLLLEENQSPKDIPRENIKHIFCLSDHRNSDKVAEYPQIYKYQSAKEAYKEIVSHYYKLENINHSEYNDGNVRFISVFTPIPGYTKASFAWTLANILSENKKVLFVPFDLLPINQLYGRETLNQAISEFIYYWQEENEDVNLKMKSLLQYSGKLAHLSGVTHGLDLLSITGEDIRRWIENLQVNKDFDEVVFYLGMYTEATVEVIKKSQKCYVVIGEGVYEEKVMKEWERQMIFLEIPLQKDKFVKVLLPDLELLDSNNMQVQYCDGIRSMALQQALKL
ncbi:hypothetical protein I5677_08925 [Mobilitalea sibirica]|uniref:AAA domain-containing protein n=1 Tax=Mobilitalea sibirica TaxID=1462919 RepID=A0A8J7H2K2_9FIRM|nr:hypothetical protein [Mobilitalea sibirica]MBH1941012.1 hypothetical protein [Mobilitalea sibirica]